MPDAADLRRAGVAEHREEIVPIRRLQAVLQALVILRRGRAASTTARWKAVRAGGVDRLGQAPPGGRASRRPGWSCAKENRTSAGLRRELEEREHVRSCRCGSRDSRPRRPAGKTRRAAIRSGETPVFPSAATSRWRPCSIRSPLRAIVSKGLMRPSASTGRRPNPARSNPPEFPVGTRVAPTQARTRTRVARGKYLLIMTGPPSAGLRRIRVGQRIRRTAAGAAGRTRAGASRTPP